MMDKRLFISLLSVVLFALSGFPGDGTSTEDVEELSIEKLLHIETITATQKAQTAARAPAIISVLTADQIDKLGITNLYEALDYLPGVTVIQSYFGYTMINIRGMPQIHYNNRVLFMINGHVMREVINGSFHLEVVPINAVERIEVIRGPGSALYGTNAFAGIVNIITKQGDQKSTNSIEIGGGSFDTFEGSFSYGNGDERSNFFVSASTRGDAGYPYSVKQDESGQVGELKFENDLTNFFGSFTYKTVTVNTALFNHKRSKFGLVPVLDYSGPSEFDFFYADAVWKDDISDRMALSARLRYDEIDREENVGHFPFDGFLGHENANTTLYSSGALAGAEFQMDYTYSDTISILTGVVYEYSETNPYLFKFVEDGALHPMSAYFTSYNTHDTSIFGQAAIEATEKLDLLLGFRFNSNSDSGSFWVPRLGLVYQFNGNTYLKALYGEAYRTPNFFTKYVTTFNVLYGDPNLGPERVRNFDLALDTTLKEKINLRLNAFYLQTNDLLLRVPTILPDEQGANAVVYTNAGSEDIWGFEADLNTSIGRRIDLFFNYAYLDGENVETGEELAYIPRNTLNAGISWKATRVLGVHPNAQYVGSQGEVDDYLLLNLVLSLKLEMGWTIYFTGRNLTNENYTYPEYVRRAISEIPGGPERSMFIRVRKEF